MSAANIYVTVITNYSRTVSGISDFYSMDDLRAHMMGDNAWLRLTDMGEIDGCSGLQHYVRCAQIAYWTVEADDV